MTIIQALNHKWFRKLNINNTLKLKTLNNGQNNNIELSNLLKNIQNNNN